MKKIIISGFDPFDKMKINPSMEVVKELHTIAGKGWRFTLSFFLLSMEFLLIWS